MTQAFGSARLAKEALRPAYNPAAFSENVSEWISYFSREHFRALPGRHTEASGPLDRRYAAIGNVTGRANPRQSSFGLGAGELKTLADITHTTSGNAWADGTEYPHCFDNLSVRQSETRWRVNI